MGEWTDDGLQERLTLLFSARVVTIEGRNLDRLIDLLQRRQWRAVKEHDRAVIADRENRNRSLPAGKQLMIIRRISVDPPIITLVRDIVGATTSKEELFNES